MKGHHCTVARRSSHLHSRCWALGGSAWPCFGSSCSQASIVEGFAHACCNNGHPYDGHPEVPAVVLASSVDADESIGKAKEEQGPARVLVCRLPPSPAQHTACLVRCARGEVKEIKTSSILQTESSALAKAATLLDQ